MKESFLRRYQKWIWWIIAIPVLATFSITNTCYNAFAHKGGVTVARFTLPSGKKVEIRDAEYRDFVANRKTMVQSHEVRKEEVLTFIMCYYAAVEAGVYVSEQEVMSTIRNFMPSRQSYELFLKGQGIDAPTLELYLKRLLTVNFYQSSLYQASFADGDEILKKWQEMNEEFKFEFVNFSPADSRKTLDTKSVSDEDLQKYLDGLSEQQRNQKYKKEAKYAIEGLSYKLSSNQDAALTALVKDELNETELKKYFEENKYDRFKFTQPESKEKKEGEAAKPPKLFYEYEEVIERVKREAKLKKALEELAKKANEESKKENFLFADFGKTYGLEYFSISEPKTRQELQTVERFGGFRLAAQAGLLKEGTFSEAPLMSTDDIFIYRVSNKIPEGIPALAEIREKVLEDYLDRKSWELAREQAKAFIAEVNPPKEAAATKDGKPEEGKSEEAKPEEKPIQERFEKVASSKNLKTETVDFYSRYFNQTMAYRNGPDSPTKYLKGYYGIFGLKAGNLSQPIEDQPNKLVHVVLLLDRKFPDIQSATAADFEKAKNGPAAVSKFEDFSYEGLKKAFHLETDIKDEG